MGILIVSLAGAMPVRAAEPQDSAGAAVELLQRQQALAAGDVDGRMALASWCEDHQLPNQAAELYQQVLALDAKHEKAYEQLVAIRDTTRLPDDPKRQQQLQEQFGSDFQLFVSPHFVIFHKADEQWMRNRAALLEKTHDVFFSTFRRYDYRVLPLHERLVCVLFADHPSYAAHAMDRDGIEVGWMDYAGYPEYRQPFPPFEHGVSVLDLLFCTGPRAREHALGAGALPSSAVRSVHAVGRHDPLAPLPGD